MKRKRKSKNKRVLSPRCKRMKRPGRLRAAAMWLKKYSGQNVLRGYCQHFAVDWRCAALELKQLGVQLDADYLNQREVTEQALIKARRQKNEARAAAAEPEPWPPYESAFEAYLAEDYEALYVLEQSEYSDGVATPEAEANWRPSRIDDRGPEERDPGGRSD